MSANRERLAFAAGVAVVLVVILIAVVALTAGGGSSGRSGSSAAPRWARGCRRSACLRCPRRAPCCTSTSTSTCS
jgi:hypothetical protein